MKQGTKTLLLWGLLVVMFAGIWWALRADGTPATAAPSSTGSWFPTALLGASVFTAFIAYRRLLETAAAHNAALRASSAHLEAWRFEEAERAVEGVARSRMRQFRRAANLRLAEVAAHRRDRDEALARVEPALAEPMGWAFRSSERTTMLWARGLRAFLRASAGDEQGARDDIRAVHSATVAEPEVLARAALAQALLLDRKSDRAGLRDLLERSRPLLLHATSRHDRALVRAYEAMLDSRPASVYRQKGESAAAGDEAITEWVARYAPNAAPFVRASAPVGGDETGETARAEAPSKKARRKLEKARRGKAKKPNASKTLMAWVLLVMILLGLWTYGGWPARGLAIVGIGGLGLWMTLAIRRQMRDSRRINAAARALGAGDLERAAAEIDFDAKAALHRANAAHVRAEIALRRGDMTQAVAECDRAFAALAEAQGGELTAPVAPSDGKEVTWDMRHTLAAQRSFALAVLGRADEAWAEIAWANGFPDGCALFRVRLAARLAAGDFPGAARTAQARNPATMLSVREEMLADLALFVGREAAQSEGQAARLRAELRRDPDIKQWVEAVAPGLLEAFEKVIVPLQESASLR